MDGWFPRYSPNGRTLTRGAVDLTIGDLVHPNGISTAWVDDGRVLYRQHDGYALRIYEVGSGVEQDVGWQSTHADARSGKWVYITAGPKAVAWDGREWPGFGGGNSGCAIADDGTIALLKHADGSVWLVPPGETTPRYLAPLGATVRASGARFTWAANRRVYGYDMLSGDLVDLTVDPDTEFWPVPFRVGDEYWVLSFTHTRCLLRPWGNREGYVVAENTETMYPDAAFDGTYLRVAYSSSKGVPVEWSILPSAPRVDLSAITPAYVESAAGTLVRDLWRFVAGEPGYWPRSGTHQMHCHRTWEGQSASAWFVKFGAANKWERWALVGDTIYHVEDHVDDHRGVAYQFSDGRWLKNAMRVGDRLDCAENHIRWFRDGAWTAWEPFPYVMTLDAHRVYRDGTEEIVWTYDPGTSRDTREVYTGKLDLGWESWEEWSQATGARLARSEWPQWAGGVVAPVGAVVPWPEPRPVIIDDDEDGEDEVKPREQFYAEFNEVNAFYAAPEGLKRPGGMVLGNGAADTEAMAAWGYDLMSGKTVNQVKTAIAHSEEWAQKHPGETPPSFS